MRILVGCEFSGVVREAFRAFSGVEAFSCDLLPCEDGRTDYHIQGDVEGALALGWDLAILHPPCTNLTVSGLHHNLRNPERAERTERDLAFVRRLLSADVRHIALENPVGCISSRIRKPDQIIHPWQFGHPESKTTCLWLKNLPKLVPTDILTPTRFQKNGRPQWDNQTPTGQNKLGPSADRWKLRSVTYSGIAKAMADQWVPHILKTL